jgi:hypothetical protein
MSSEPSPTTIQRTDAAHGLTVTGGDQRALPQAKVSGVRASSEGPSAKKRRHKRGHVTMVLEAYPHVIEYLESESARLGLSPGELLRRMVIERNHREAAKVFAAPPTQHNRDVA